MVIIVPTIRIEFVSDERSFVRHFNEAQTNAEPNQNNWGSMYMLRALYLIIAARARYATSIFVVTVRCSRDGTDQLLVSRSHGSILRSVNSIYGKYACGFMPETASALLHECPPVEYKYDSFVLGASRQSAYN